MRYSTEDLPKVVEQVKVNISDFGLSVSDFDISVDEDKRKIRVEYHDINQGGFIVNLFASWDFEDLVTRIEEMA